MWIGKVFTMIANDLKDFSSLGVKLVINNSYGSSAVIFLTFKFQEAYY